MITMRGDAPRTRPGRNRRCPRAGQRHGRPAPRPRHRPSAGRGCAECGASRVAERGPEVSTISRAAYAPRRVPPESRREVLAHPRRQASPTARRVPIPAPVERSIQRRVSRPRRSSPGPAGRSGTGRSSRHPVTDSDSRVSPGPWKPMVAMPSCVEELEKPRPEAAADARRAPWIVAAEAPDHPAHVDAAAARIDMRGRCSGACARGRTAGAEVERSTVGLSVTVRIAVMAVVHEFRQRYRDALSGGWRRSASHEDATGQPKHQLVGRRHVAEAVASRASTKPMPGKGMW